MALRFVNPGIILLDQFNITPQFKDINFEIMAEALDKTTFGQTTRIHQAGLGGYSFDMGGFFDANDDPLGIDDILEPRLRTGQDCLATVVPGLGLDGELAYLLPGFVTNYSPFTGAVGELHGITFQFMNRMGAAGAVRGNILLPLSGLLEASDVGIGRNLGAVVAGKRVWAALHVLSVAGTDDPTLTVTVESDVDDTWAGAETRLTFAAKTAPGFQGLLSAAGPITDTWWRANFTISGTDPEFTALLAVGIK